MRSRPWWVVPILLYAGVRVVDTALIFVAGRAYSDAGTSAFQYDTSQTGYWRLASLWDGQWYWSIADHGYPSQLPRVDGEVVRNPLAFYPAFPAVARLLMFLPGVSFPVAGVVISIAAAGLASVLAYDLARRRQGTFFASAAVLAMNVYPAAPLLQMAYTEGMALLLVVSALWCLERHWHGAALVACILLSLTRPIALALALVLAIHSCRCRLENAAARWAVPALAIASFAVWPLAVALRTGEATAYLQTQKAWFVVSPDSMTESWLDLLVSGGPVVLGLLLAFSCLLLTLVLRPSGRVWGLDTQAWATSYVVFLALATRPISSMIRFGLLVGPALWSLAPSDHDGRSARSGRIVLLVLVTVLGLASQYLWLRWFYVPSRYLVSFP